MPHKLTTSEFQERLYNIYGNRFDVLGEYINNCTKIAIKCNVCGNTIYKAPVKMTGVDRSGCYICSGKNRYKTTESFQKEIDERYPNTYKILGEYVRARSPLEVLRIPCGHTYMISPDNLLRGKGCPKCSIRQSHYMDIVEEYLNKHGILFEKEKRFDDCKYERVLPFDYYLPKYNICIEVDGEYHYLDNFVYHKSEKAILDFYKLKQRDEIKTQYCKDKNIKLLRLPYYEEKNFEQLLNDFIC